MTQVFPRISAAEKMYGPTQAYSEYVHSTKHRLPGETFEQAKWRVASALSDNDTHAKAFFDITYNMRFLEGGRIQRGAGSGHNVTQLNCFVMNVIHDSFVHGSGNGALDSIMDIAKQAAETMQKGGGVGYDFSTLRPSGDLIKGVMSTTDGPVAFMHIYDAICGATSSAGNRRGAQMATMRIDHPDIRKFIRSKQPPENARVLWHYVKSLSDDDLMKPQLMMALQETLKLTRFNISVGVTDYFMECLYTGKPFPLMFNGKVYDWVDSNELWNEIMESNWNNGEPGVQFIDKVNRMNNLYYCETIYTSNPCGEQYLPAFGACLLGSHNLIQYVYSGSFDFEQLNRDIPIVARGMDNVNDVSRFPLEAQRIEARNKRRMGIGVTGLADALAYLGLEYGSKEFLEFESKIMETIAIGYYQAGVELAREKGAFPFFDADRFCDSEFVKTRLPKELVKDIHSHGIRYGTCTSIAPTGSISMASDNISPSIEPPFMLYGDRRIKTPDGEITVTVSDYAFREWGIKPKTADEVTAFEHVAVLNAAAEWCDASVSKTCNVGPDVSWDDFNKIYNMAWQGAAKGCTTFRSNCDRIGIMVKKDHEATEGNACYVDEMGRKSCE